MARAIVCATITFGLVSVPIKLYTSAAPVKIDFCMLSKDGNRCKQQLVDEITGQEVNRNDAARGFEHSKGQYLKFEQEELKKLESQSDGLIVIKEFVPAGTVDRVAIDRTYYLGPDKAGDRGYALLSRTLRKLGKVAVATWSARGRDKLIVIEPYRDGLILHEMFYANEVRPFEEITVAKLQVSDMEVELAERLVESLSTEQYNPAPYCDGYRKRVQEAVEQKLQGKEIETPAEPPVQPSIINLLEALKRSLETSPAQKRPQPRV